jgi:hypothetical protein
MGNCSTQKLQIQDAKQKFIRACYELEELDISFLQDLSDVKLARAQIKIENKNFYYLGEINDKNETHGKGVLFYDSELTNPLFVGYFHNGKKYKGKLFFPSSNYAYGVFENDHLTSGMINLHDASYEGNFQNLFMHGLGTIRFISSNRTFQGIYEYDSLIKLTLYTDNYIKAKMIHDGIYKITYQNGDKYIGEIKVNFTQNVLPHGMGKLTYMNPTDTTGDSYQGLFVNGKKHGKGIKYMEGAQYEQTYTHDILINEYIKI